MGAAKKLDYPLAMQMLQKYQAEGRLGPPEELSIKAIRVEDAKLQARVRTIPEHAQKLGEMHAAGIDLHPVVVFLIAGVYWLADGFHRVWLYKNKLKLPSIKAHVIRDASMNEALAFAAAANLWLTQLQPTKEDKEAMLKKMLGDPEMKTWNTSRLASLCGLSHARSSGIRALYCKQKGEPLPDKVKSFKSDGSVYHHSPLRVRDAGQNPRISSASSSCETKRFAFGGKDYLISSSSKDPNGAAEVILKNIEKYRTKISSITYFRDWLNSLQIPSKTLSLDKTKYQALSISGACVIPIASFNIDSVLSAIARIILVARKADFDSRLILVYQKDINIAPADMSQASSLAFVASSLPHPFRIEFMTPEEFKAEFGPKGGES